MRPPLGNCGDMIRNTRILKAVGGDDTGASRHGSHPPVCWLQYHVTVMRNAQCNRCADTRPDTDYTDPDYTQIRVGSL